MCKTVPARAGSLALAIALTTSLAACGSAPARVGKVDSTPIIEDGQGSYSANEDTGYILRPSDVIAVTVFREPELSVPSVPVGSDGTISLPLIGTLKVEGMTPEQLQQELMRRLSAGTLVNPSVSVNILQFGSHLVTVEGSVEKPGMYPFRPGTRLSGALALAAGTSRVAKLDEVAIFRQMPDGMYVAKFNYAAVRAGTMLDPVIRPNDRVVIGTSSLSQLWQDFLRTVPALALFTRF